MIKVRGLSIYNPKSRENYTHKNRHFDGFPSFTSDEPCADEQEPTCHNVARQIGEHEKEPKEEWGSLSAINGCIFTTTK